MTVLQPRIGEASSPDEVCDSANVGHARILQILSGILAFAQESSTDFSRDAVKKDNYRSSIMQRLRLRHYQKGSEMLSS
jgi:hypothetical protein